MDESTRAELRHLMITCRQAGLAVSEGNVPFTAMTAYVAEPALRSVLVHLSNLAPHKRMLLANPQCSLIIAEPDDGRAEVMSLARVTLQGRAAKIEKESMDYAEAKALYLARLPASRLMFDLADFDLIRIHVAGGRYIAGFARAFSFTAEDL